MFFDILHPMQQVSMVCENKVIQFNQFSNYLQFSYRIVDLRKNQQYRFVSPRNARAITAIILYDIVRSATIIATTIKGVAIISFISVYRRRGRWMPKCKVIWSKRSLGIVNARLDGERLLFFYIFLLFLYFGAESFESGLCQFLPDFVLVIFATTPWTYVSIR